MPNKNCERNSINFAQPTVFSTVLFLFDDLMAFEREKK